jgi:hypothetical protein
MEDVKPDNTLETLVEKTIGEHVKGFKKGDPELTKALAVATRFLAVKAKLILPESGSGLEDDI